MTLRNEDILMIGQGQLYPAVGLTEYACVGSVGVSWELFCSQAAVSITWEAIRNANFQPHCDLLNHIFWVGVQQPVL